MFKPNALKSHRTRQVLIILAIIIIAGTIMFNDLIILILDTMILYQANHTTPQTTPKGIHIRGIITLAIGTTIVHQTTLTTIRIIQTFLKTLIETDTLALEDHMLMLSVRLCPDTYRLLIPFSSQNRLDRIHTKPIRTCQHLFY